MSITCRGMSRVDRANKQGKPVVEVAQDTVYSNSVKVRESSAGVFEDKLLP